MRVPQSWVTEVLQKANAGWEVTPPELDADFVRVGLEVEEVEGFEPVSGPLVVGRVTTIAELEGFAKPVRHCRVDVGESEPRGIVCGARNFSEGDSVVVALPGAELPGGFAIASRETYGKISDGMICSPSEIGLGSDHSGILVLEPGLAEPGDDALPLLGLDDTVFELAVTPDRGYCLSVRGLARELACGYDLDFADPADVAPCAADGPGPRVDLRAETCAARFAMRAVSGVDPSAVTPWWLRRRLLLAGIRPISAAVDVTNYVMLELGQPLHAFDADAVSGGFVVRRATQGEVLTTLDDVQRALDPEDVVICDETGPVSLAGVMGGAATEVRGSSTRILLEAACWDPLAVFKTARRHKLPSEASRRFERHVDPAVAAAALDRAAALLVDIAGGSIEPVLTDVGGVPERPAIAMAEAMPERIAGTTYPDGACARRLTQIGCAVTERVGDAGASVLDVVPPSWRPDLGQPADLVEEVLRLEGLEKIPSVLPHAPAGRGLSGGQRRRRALGRALAHGGYVEVLPTPFLSSVVFDDWGLEHDDPRRRTTSVLNPLESDRAELATTLLPGMLEIAARNVARGRRDVSLFAIAQVVLPDAGTGPVEALPVDRRPTDEQIRTLLRSLPDQPVHLAAVLTGLREPRGHWGAGRAAEAADAVDVARLVARTTGADIEIGADQHLPWHPGRCARLTVDGVTVGHAGELHPAVLERMDMPARTCAVEIDLDGLPLTERYPAPSISAYPAVLQDVAVVVDESVPASHVEAALRAGAGDLLEDIALFDVFTGDQVGEGCKSLAYAMRFRAADRTLTEHEASGHREAAVAAAAESVGAVLRG